MDDALEQILEAWQTNHRINELMIDQISAEGMQCSLSKRGGRNVLRQFTHMHNVRYWQLENRAVDLIEGLHKFAAAEEPEPQALKQHMLTSTHRVAKFFTRCVTNTGDRKAFEKGVVTHLGYFISHESHHRGSILLTLKECGHNLDKKTRYAVWNWQRI